jgi:hypothetical protein
MSFTYSTIAPMSNLHLVRLYTGDTVDAGHTFEDEEITAFLSVSGQIPYAAAAFAYESLARGVGRGLLKRTTYGDETKEYYTVAELLTLAARLRASGNSGGGPAVGRIRDRANYDPTYPPQHFIMPSGVVPTVPIETDLGNSDGE